MCFRNMLLKAAVNSVNEFIGIKWFVEEIIGSKTQSIPSIFLVTVAGDDDNTGQRFKLFRGLEHLEAISTRQDQGLGAVVFILSQFRLFGQALIVFVA